VVQLKERQFHCRQNVVLDPGSDRRGRRKITNRGIKESKRYETKASGAGQEQDMQIRKKVNEKIREIMGSKAGGSKLKVRKQWK
jgi:hypothetical protein